MTYRHKDLLQTQNIVSRIKTMQTAIKFLLLNCNNPLANL